MDAFPKSIYDISGMADWLELTALKADDNDASIGDLERELNRQNARHKDDKLIQVISELRRRGKAAKDAYPFDFQRTNLTLRPDGDRSVPYLFCLILSYLGWKLKKGVVTNPWLLFEQLSWLAAREYVGGEAMLFGTSCRINGQQKRFRDQVKRLAEGLGEGDGYRALPNVRVQDGKVDVVAWKAFPDSRGSQFVLFGQCAAGADWKGDKLSSLRPREGFWDSWMMSAPLSPLVHSYFMPHRVWDDGDWQVSARRGGVIFDRCRIAFCSAQDTTPDASDIFARLRSSCKEHWDYELPDS